MSHIGVKRFGSGHCQYDRAKQHKTPPGIEQDQIDRVARIESPDDGGITDNFDRTKEADRDEPDDYYRAEIPADAAR
jgi:hypothetical protein